MPFLHFSVKMLATFSYSLYFCRKYHNEMTTSVALSKIRQTAISAIPDGGKAILYGSRARGDARMDSDWDILILLDKDVLNQSDYDNISYPFVLLGCDLGQEINPIMYTKKEWESYRITPFYENVVRDGIELV
jgi:hypothetical protein